MAQAGDPLNTGKGGSSINGLLFGEQARFFDDEIRPRLKHSKRGIVGMASARPNQNGSEFYIQLSSFPLDSLDEKHTIFGEVSEGLELLERMNEAAVDAEGRPIQNIRIRHTLVLDDPFEDPQGEELRTRFATLCPLAKLALFTLTFLENERDTAPHAMKHARRSRSPDPRVLSRARPEPQRPAHRGGLGARGGREGPRGDREGTQSQGGGQPSRGARDDWGSARCGRQAPAQRCLHLQGGSTRV